MESNTRFEIGSTVIYSTHGKCLIKDIETKTINGQNLQFYKLEIQKHTIGKPKKADTAIFLPVAQAEKQGLRAPMTEQIAQEILQILENEEYYFPLNEPWPTVLQKMETAICTEGAIGLAKSYSFLFVLNKKQVTSRAEVTKFDETIKKILVRELADALAKTVRETEELVEKSIRKKSLMDH